MIECLASVFAARKGRCGQVRTQNRGRARADGNTRQSSSVTLCLCAPCPLQAKLRKLVTPLMTIYSCPP